MPGNDRTSLMEKNRAIREKLLKWAPEPGDYQTSIEGFSLFRRDDCDSCDNCFYEPAVGVVIQGEKRSIVGSQEYHYRENDSLLNSVDLPSKNYILDARPEKPFLGLGLKIDKYMVGQLIAELPQLSQSSDEPVKGLSVTLIETDLLDAFLRLTELLDKPDQIPVLAPMIIREIHYRLLVGPRGKFLRAINTAGSQGNRIAQVISWLRENYKEPLQVDELARKANMATSTFHRRFKQITTLSPLQYQKRLRLYEAQRLMLVENEYAANACLAVGYESPTQFNREYKRLFGEPPSRNIHKVREVQIQPS